MEYEDADKVRVSLENKWNSIRTELESDPQKFGLSKIDRSTINDPVEDYYEGPAIMFPELEARLENNAKVLIRTSVTVCVKPHHSKIWVRSSYINGGNKVELADVYDFYQKAKSASRLIANELLNSYRHSLTQNNLNESLVKAHEICIETMSKDLGDIAELFERDSFSMPALLADESNLRVLSGFLNRTLNKQPASSDDVVTGLSKGFDWFRMKVSKPGVGELVGVYSMCHTEGATSFTGLVQEPPRIIVQDGSKYHITREFSKRLVQHIASAF
jgi:hypothetical protein